MTQIARVMAINKVRSLRLIEVGGAANIRPGPRAGLPGHYIRQGGCSCSDARGDADHDRATPSPGHEPSFIQRVQVPMPTFVFAV
jgi:hypothetical protein